MDGLRGQFPGFGLAADDQDGAVVADTVDEAPPRPVGQDDRRMQVRAYNHWAGLLDNRTFPSIEDLDPHALPDFGPYSVLLDFSAGIANPAICFLGEQLAAECVGDESIRSLADVPARSLLSRITDHYMQILANQAPIGFEAEFINQRATTILYRGILLPFSSDQNTIDFIYGVINWKELPDPLTTDELLLEIEQALDVKPDSLRDGHAFTDWADGPVETNASDTQDMLELLTPLEPGANESLWPEPAFGTDDVIPSFPPFAVFPSEEIAPEAMELADWLASARELAQVAMGTEDRSRHALYAAIGRAYDFSLAAASSPQDFKDLVRDCGLTVQDRAPMTPVVKLVFGAEYDKTRLTEYASALGHAHRLRLARGSLAGFLSSTPGGLKGVVHAERSLKREESGKAAADRESPRDVLARKLRGLDHRPLASIAGEGNEFTLLVARRMPNGEVVVLGEVDDDIALLERATRRVVAQH